MATKKITKRDRYSELLSLAEVAANPELVEFINHEIELLDKKNASASNAERKPSAAQLANTELADKIAAEMLPEHWYTVGEMRKMFKSCAGMTPQRASGLVNILVKQGKVEFDERSKGRYYKLANRVG